MNYNNHIMNNAYRANDRCAQGRTRNEGGVNNMCNSCDNRCKNEHGDEVYSLNVGRTACKNQNFRESYWTGRFLQMTLMSIPCGDDIGVEMHCDTDQYIRVEQGMAIALIGHSADNCCHKHKLNVGDAIFIPAGTWHNIVNASRHPLKISSIYAPPHHPKCTVERRKNNE